MGETSPLAEGRLVKHLAWRKDFYIWTNFVYQLIVKDSTVLGSFTFFFFFFLTCVFAQGCYLLVAENCMEMYGDSVCFWGDLCASKSCKPSPQSIFMASNIFLFPLLFSRQEASHFGFTSSKRERKQLI